jgi:hypothetical protein
MVDALIFGVKFMFAVIGLIATAIALFIFLLWWIENRK